MSRGEGTPVRMSAETLDRKLASAMQSIHADIHDERLRTGDGVEDALDTLSRLRDDLCDPAANREETP